MLPLVATSEFSKIFTGELSALMERARSSLEALAQNPRDDSALADALAAYHSMGSMGGMAKAIGIEKVGRLFERLIDVASTFAISDPDQAMAIFSTCQKHLPVLHEIIGVTLSGREEEGEAAAEQVRLQVFEDWGGYYYQPLPGMVVNSAPPIVTKAEQPSPLPVPAPVRPEVDASSHPVPAPVDSPVDDGAFDAFDAAVREAGLAPEHPRNGPFPLDVVLPQANLTGEAPRPMSVPSPGPVPEAPRSEDEDIAEFLSMVGTPVPEAAPPPEAPPLPLRAPIISKETKRITTPRFEPVPPPVRTTRVPSGFTPVPQPPMAETGSRSSDGSLSFISASKPIIGSLSGAAAPPPPPVSAPAPAPAPAPEDSHVDREMLEFFIPETEEYCETMERAVEAWERDPSDEQPVQTLMRLFHTIKGAANSIGLSHMGRLSHSMEEMFMGLDEKRIHVPLPLQQKLSADSVQVMRQCLRRVQATPPVFTAPQALEDLILRTDRAIAGEQIAVEVGAETPGVSAELTAPVAPEVSEAPVQLPFEPEGVPLEAPAEVAAFAAEQSAVVAEVTPVPLAGPVTTMVTVDEEDETYSESQVAARIEPARLDLLMNLIGELIVGRNQLQTRLSGFNSLQRELENAKNRLLDVVADFQEKYEYSPVGGMGGAAAGLPPGVGAGGGSVLARPIKSLPPGTVHGDGGAQPEGFSDLEFDRYDDLNILCRALVEIGNDANEVITQSGKFINLFNDETDRFSKTASRLQETITAVRLTPLESLFRRLTRVANQASSAEGKQVRFSTEGAATKLDRVVIDQIFQPLLHLVRNAVSHGIESDEVRASRGKETNGTVMLKASQRAGQVILELTDDGGGMDLAAIKQRGIERGFIDPNAEMNESQLINLIFQPGFSTARTVTDISGRGIGMDVVRREITRLNGSIEIRSRAGQGSTITLRVPVTLSVNQAAFVAVGAEVYALAANFLERAVTVKKADIVRGSDGQEMLPLDGGAVPFLRIDQLLDCPPALDAIPTEDQHAVVVQLADEFFALGVDRSLGRQDIVVKGLGPILAGHPFFNGGTIGPDGRVVLLLDLPGISQQIFERSGRVALVRAQAASAPEPVGLAGSGTNDRRALAPILIVDDSLSIRKVAEKYVGELGYRTDTAADGAAALEKIKRNTYSLVMTDLEMPRMHGFDLLAAIRSHEPTKDLPVLVVTSRAAEKHRWQAKELGASDYVVKPFSKEQLAEKFDRYLNLTPVTG